MLIDRHAAGGLGDRERISRARQAAEELFKPKRAAADAEGITAAADPSASTKQQPPRQPRIIAVQPVAPMSTVKDETPAEPKPGRKSTTVGQRKAHILASQFGRVRALMNYGMTRAQVAELYGVGIDEIDRIARRRTSHQHIGAADGGSV